MAGFSIILHTTIFFILLTCVSGQDCEIEIPPGTPEKNVPLFCHVRVYCTYNGDDVNKIWYIKEHLWNDLSNQYLEPTISISDTMSFLSIIAKCYCNSHGCVYNILVSCNYFLNNLNLVTESTTLNLEANEGMDASCVFMTSKVTKTSDIVTDIVRESINPSSTHDIETLTTPNSSPSCVSMTSKVTKTSDIVTDIVRESIIPSSTHDIETLSVSSTLTSSNGLITPSPSSHITPNSSPNTTTTDKNKAPIQIKTILMIAVPVVVIVGVFIAALLLVCCLCRKQLFPESGDSMCSTSTPSDEISNLHAAGTGQEDIALPRLQSLGFHQDQFDDPSNFYTEASSPSSGTSS